ncbi:MAG: GTP 3',8-cyclase MoaA [Chitinophagaceae bacterium]
MVELKQEIVDSFGRSFKTLRVSLVNRCNLACTYCVPDGKQEHKAQGPSLLDFNQMIGLVRALHDLLQLTTLRLTGGEPLLYPPLIPFLNQVKEMDIPNICMSTNGYLLAGKCRSLKEGGLNQINISLDALEENVFLKMSKRKNLSQVLKGIEQAVALGLTVKINCVVLRAINDHQILPLFNYCHGLRIPIRFLEVMKMGHLNQADHHLFFSQEEILNRLGETQTFTSLGRSISATASYWQLPDGYQFGIIANESAPFCQDCNRLRLDAYGHIYGCLSSPESVSVLEALRNPPEMIIKLKEALARKKTKFSGSPLSMRSIGG